ncbi:hypothetical protein GCM10009765_01810 [Fodinicola feengrottensis]|uniref:Transposase IS701-like DDE domain-containing protein n=1 Tax=Fodinicola feengrottensis TaxID=435914 RepID=A0ABN2FQ36_9ACTN
MFARILNGMCWTFLGALPRADQRVKAQVYRRGALTDGQRKSMWPTADRISAGFQQFVSSSTRPAEPVRARLAQLADEVISQVGWLLDDTGFPKDGKHSPGVA